MITIKDLDTILSKIVARCYDDIHEGSTRVGNKFHVNTFIREIASRIVVIVFTNI